jgi:hypothetical protein
MVAELPPQQAVLAGLLRLALSQQQQRQQQQGQQQQQS